MDIAIDALKRISNETNSHVAAQGHAALERLVRFRSQDDTSLADCQVLIPFFGTISIQLDKLLRRYAPPQTGATALTPDGTEVNHGFPNMTGFPASLDLTHAPVQSLLVLYDGVYGYQSDTSFSASMGFGMDMDLNWNEILRSANQ
jgi:hypothetical protein